MQGTLKTFNANRGFGFITNDGVDYFFHKSEVKGRPVKEGDTLTFDTAPNTKDPSKTEAKNVTGGTAGGSTEGIVKWYNTYKGYGFIEVGEASHFAHANEITGGTLMEGDHVWFDVAPSEKDPTKTQAKNIAGGTGFPMGKGYGKGWGQPDMQQMMWMMQQMGKGWGKGYGK